MDITSYIAALSMDMAQQSVQSTASLKMFKNVMDSSEAASTQLVEALEEIPAPSSGVGSLLDVRA